MRYWSEKSVIVRQGATGLLVVLAASCGGTAGTGADPDRMLEVGPSFAVDAAGAVALSPCDVRNDGVVDR